jgi:hypothetical protein
MEMKPNRNPGMVINGQGSRSSLPWWYIVSDLYGVLNEQGLDHPILSGMLHHCLCVVKMSKGLRI